MRSEENRPSVTTKLQEASFNNQPPLGARIQASRRLKLANMHLQEALDPGAGAAALAPAEGEVTAAVPEDRLERAHTAATAGDAHPSIVHTPPSPKAFAQLHSDKITAQSIQRAQARGVRLAKRQADYARLMLSRALDKFEASAGHAENEALKAAIDHESQCSLALTEAHREHVASVDALYRAQEAYHRAIRRAPREALAARMATAMGASSARRETAKQVRWPDDAMLEQLRWIPAPGEGDDF